MNKRSKESFRERLVATDRMNPTLKQRYEKELQTMFEKNFNRVDRAVTLLVSAYLVFAAVDLTIAAAGGEAFLFGFWQLPGPLLLSFAVFCLGGAGFTAWVGLKGKLDRRRFATLQTSWFLGMAFFLVSLHFVWWLTDPAIENKTFLAIWALLIVIYAVYAALEQRVKHAELDTREKLLEIQIGLAELADKVGEKKSV
jgi:cation transport ATPase